LINSFNVGLKVGGDNRPLIIQPIGESMTKKEKEKENWHKYFKFIEKSYVDEVKIETKGFSKDQLIEKIASLIREDDEEYSSQTGYTYAYLGGLSEDEMKRKFKEKIKK